MTESADLPLYQLRPGLRSIPRVSLCQLPSPVQHVQGDGASLWIKRDDLNAAVCGGNKARTLEWLLATVGEGDTVLTLGGEGSTHVLSTATHAARLGAKTVAYRWQHEMNETSLRVAPLLEERCIEAPLSTSTIAAILRADWFRTRRRGTGLHYVPIGGSVPLGMLAHVNAAIELAIQVRDGVLPRPRRIVLPLGSGGTMAGLVLGLAIARLDVPVTGVQVTPRLVANRWRLRRLVARTARLIERVGGEPAARPDWRLVNIERGVYGGAYGRSVDDAVKAARWLEDASGIVLDHTYSAKAFAVALALSRVERRHTGANGVDEPTSSRTHLVHAANGPYDIARETNDHRPVLFWNTFDGRLIDKRE